MQWLKDRPLTVLLLSCIPLFLVHLGELAVNIMEARNFITAREMLVDDNWLLTTITALSETTFTHLAHCFLRSAFWA